MRRILAMLGVVGMLMGVQAAQEPGAGASAVQFRAVDGFVDAGAQPLAAYQLEVLATTGRVKIVGIEGGEPAAFREPPYHDPKAIQRERVILAAFSTRQPGQLPSGRFRVATLHVQVEGGGAPRFAGRLQTAADADGRPIRVQLNLVERNIP